MNKIKYNLKNVHYAVIEQEGTSNTWPTYGKPVPWPGAVELNMEQQGSISKFYADGIVYWQAAKNNGYEGDLTMALILDQFRIDCLGEELDDTAKVYLEKVTGKGKSFALLFEFDGDTTNTRHILYNCTATRPNIAGKTNEEEVEPNTESLTLSAVALPNGYVKARTGTETIENEVEGWYNAVWMPGK